MSEETVALVLAGGHVGGYGVLTHNRTKGALPFAGHYRIIDFVMSNLSNSGILNVGVITQYLPASLIEHIGAGDSWDLHGRDRMVKIMPPFVGVKQTTWFRGTSDAILRNLSLVEDLDPENVMIMSGEHIYRMNYEKAIEQHRENNADLTIIGKKLPREELSTRYGFIKTDENGKVSSFKEKPKDFLSDFISIGIYIFKKDVLMEEFMKRAENGPTQNFVYDVIEPICKTRNVFAYEYKGYWEYLRTVNDFYEVSMSLLEDDPVIKPDEWEIVTNLEDRSLGSRNPTVLDKDADVSDSLISPGCRIGGAVKGSILSPGVIVEKGATVEDSIIMHDCRIMKGARIRNVIADKNVVFEENCKAGGKVREETTNPDLPFSSKGLTVIGKGVLVGKNVEIGGSSQVYPDLDLEPYAGTKFAPGVNITFGA